MSDYREESEKSKQVKRGVVDQREKIPAQSKRSKAKYQVWGNLRFFYGNLKAWKLGSYVKLHQAEEAKRKFEHKGYLNVVIKEV